MPETKTLFNDFLRSFGGSTLFLTGAVLFTAGGIVSALPVGGWPLGLNLIGFAMTLLPIIAIWFFYTECKGDMRADKLLSGINLIRIHTKIGLVIMYIVTGVLGFAAVIAVFALLFVHVLLAIFMVFVFGLCMVMLIAIIMFYYKALLNLLESLRININENEAIEDNTYEPLKGITPFTVACGIMTCYSFLTVFMNMVMQTLPQSFFTEYNALQDEYLAELSGPFADMIKSVLESQQSPLTMLISSAGLTLSSAGILVFLVLLNQFYSSFKKIGRNSQ
jgi:hypothetical protein